MSDDSESESKSDSESASESDSDGDPLLVFDKCHTVASPPDSVTQPDNLSSMSYEECNVVESAIVTPAEATKSDSEESSSGGISESESDDDSSSSSDSEASAPCEMSAEVSAANGVFTPSSQTVPGLSKVNGQPSVVVKLPLVPRLKRNVISPQHSGIAAGQQESQLPQSNASNPPVTVSAAAKSCQLARDTIANIIGSNAVLPAAIKIPKKPKLDDRNAESSPSRRPYKSDYDEDSLHRRDEFRHYSNSPAQRYGSPSVRHDSPRSFSRIR